MSSLSVHTFTTITAIPALTGLVIPYLVVLVTKATAPRWLRAGLMLALSGLSGALTTAVWTNGESWQAYVISIVSASLVSLETHYNAKATKPLDIVTQSLGLTAPTANPKTNY